MSRGWKAGDRSSCRCGAPSRVDGSGATAIAAVRTDGLWTQQEQQDGGQHSGEPPQRQSVHAPATAAKGSRSAKTASRTAGRIEGERTMRRESYTGAAREWVYGMGRTVREFSSFCCRPAGQTGREPTPTSQFLSG